MICIIIDKKLTKKEFSLLKEIIYKENIDIKEELSKTYEVLKIENNEIDDEKIYSYNNNYYVTKLKIYDQDFMKIGYVFFNTKTCLDLFIDKKEKHCIKCGNRLSKEVPTGELSFKELSTIKNKDNLLACHSCLRIIEEKDDKEITIKNSIILKLKIS